VVRRGSARQAAPNAAPDNQNRQAASTLTPANQAKSAANAAQTTATTAVAPNVVTADGLIQGFCRTCGHGHADKAHSILVKDTVICDQCYCRHAPGKHIVGAPAQIAKNKQKWEKFGPPAPGVASVEQD